MTRDKALQKLAPEIRTLYLSRFARERVGLHKSAVYHWLASHWRGILIVGLLTQGKALIALFILLPLAFLMEGMVTLVRWTLK